MPRPTRTRCPLSDLAAALVGAAGGCAGNEAMGCRTELSGCWSTGMSPAHISHCLLARPTGGSQATAVVGVCEFSCSCCRSSTSLAADALCNYLATEGDAMQEFCSSSGGLLALQVKELLKGWVETRGTGLGGSVGARKCSAGGTSGVGGFGRQQVRQRSTAARSTCQIHPDVVLYWAPCFLAAAV